MKHLSFLFLLFAIKTSFSQELHFNYKDTAFTAAQLKIETKACVAYRSFGKILADITNLTDSFKIIYPKDISITDVNGKQIIVQGKSAFVIPPKMTKRCRFIAESTDFRGKALQLTITSVTTTDKAEMVYAFPPFVLNQETFDQVEKNIMPMATIGDVTLKLKNFKYYGKGVVRVWVSVFYRGNKFLGVKTDKLKLQSPDGKLYMEAYRPRISANYFNKDKKELRLSLKFENPSSNATRPGGEKVILEDVFIEYPTYVEHEKIELRVYKKSESTEKIKEDGGEKDDDKEEKEDKEN